jgi:Rieske Fe-S protein
VIKLVAVAGLLGGGGGLVAGAIQYAQPPVIGVSQAPTTALLDVDGSPLTVGNVQKEYSQSTLELLLFAYPLRNEPNFLLNLAPPDGSSPPTVKNPLQKYADESNPNPGNTVDYTVQQTGQKVPLVAFSAICQHLGCPAPAIAYYPPGTCPQKFGSLDFYIHCSCHGSTYDVTNAANNLTGPAVYPLPQVKLVAVSGNPKSSPAGTDPAQDAIYAVDMYPSPQPVNGHFSTLTGDYSVGNSSQIQPPSQPVITCNFNP